MVEMLKKLFSMLVLYQHNVKMLHWNVIGCDFDSIHAVLGEYADKMGLFIDDVAEIMLQLDMDILSLHEVMEYLEKDEDYNYIELRSGEKFETDDVFKYIHVFFTQLISVYEEIYKDQDLDGSIISELQTQQFWFRKEALYKNKHRKD